MIRLKINRSRYIAAGFAILSSMVVEPSSSRRRSSAMDEERRSSTTRAAAERQIEEEKSSTVIGQINKGIEAIKEAVIDPIKKALTEQLEIFRKFSVQLKEGAKYIRNLPNEIEGNLNDVFTAPEKLRAGAQLIENDFIKQINDTLADVEIQRKKVIDMKLSSMGLEDLIELEKSLLKAFDELEKFLGKDEPGKKKEETPPNLRTTLNEIQKALNETIDPVTNGVNTIKNNIKILRSKIAGAGNRPGLPQRLEVLAEILNR